LVIIPIGVGREGIFGRGWVRGRSLAGRRAWGKGRSLIRGRYLI